MNVYVIVGLGGVGGLVLRLLSPYLWHKDDQSMVICIDGDSFELKNKARMAFSRPGPKAEVLAEEMEAVYGGRVRYLRKPLYLDETNISEHIRHGDIVFCCPDNHKTRLLVEEQARNLPSCAVFSGGNDGIENGKSGTYGNVQVYLREDNRDVTNRLSTYHPEIASPQDKLPQEIGCMEQAASAPQLVFTNAAVATSLLSAFYAWERGALGHEEVYLDIETGRVQPVARKVKR